MGTSDSKQVVRMFIDELSNGNLDGALDILADDGSWWLSGSLPTSGTFVGKKAIIEEMMAEGASRVDPESMSMEIRTLIGEGDHVAVEWISRFKTLKGRDYENYYNVMFEVKDGKIQKIREYMDTQYAKEVLFD